MPGRRLTARFDREGAQDAQTRFVLALRCYPARTITSAWPALIAIAWLAMS